MFMKNNLQKAGKLMLGVMLVFIVFFGYLNFSNNIGLHQSKLKEDIRSSQPIKDDWIIEGSVSDTMAAYISYSEDKSNCIYSIYVNGPGLSFGYFFREGGSTSGIEESIAEHTVEGYSEKAYISMNRQSVERIEIDDNNSVQVIDIDSNKPFAIVLPVNAGAVTFYDVDGNTVEFCRYF